MILAPSIPQITHPQVPCHAIWFSHLGFKNLTELEQTCESLCDLAKGTQLLGKSPRRRASSICFPDQQPPSLSSVATEERLEGRKVFNQEDKMLESGGMYQHSFRYQWSSL